MTYFSGKTKENPRAHLWSACLYFAISSANYDCCKIEVKRFTGLFYIVTITVIFNKTSSLVPKFMVHPLVSCKVLVSITLTKFSFIVSRAKTLISTLCHPFIYSAYANNTAQINIQRSNYGKRNRDMNWLMFLFQWRQQICIKICKCYGGTKLYWLIR